MLGNIKLIPLILAGGSGSRLWPLSRKWHPKPLQKLMGEKTLLQNTMLRIQIEDILPPIVVCNREHQFLVAEQLRDIAIKAQIILESSARNTAPSIALGALQCLSEHSDALLLVMPADHTISDVHKFNQAIEAAIPSALRGNLVTFGVTPNYPETGYGYIQKGEILPQEAPQKKSAVFKVDRFLEKPSYESAKNYIATGNYLWNAGIFLFRASRYLDELALHAADILDNCRRALKQKQIAQENAIFIDTDPVIFNHCRSESIDYAVMEKTEHAAVVPLDAGWNDIGSWSSLMQLNEKDEAGNVVFGDVVKQQTENCYLHSSHRLVTTIGLKDHIVVETPDAVLVAHQDFSQEVKTLVNQLEKAGRAETNTHVKVHRPWGTYEVLVNAPGFKVKHICIKPHASLSLQMHQHRSEHWVVVVGTATVVNDEKTFLLQANESTFIPAGTKHRLANFTEQPLEIIEVQAGAYLGEDDIVRFEDHYGRLIG